MMNPQAFPMLRQGMNLGFHIITIHALLCKITRGNPANDKDNNCNKKALVTIFFTGTKLLVFGVLPREEKFNQYYFLAVIAPELLKKNSNSKRKVGKKEPIVHMDNSTCHYGCKIREYFARKKMVRIPIQFIPQIGHCVTSGSAVMPKSN
jgi:hypothetical protein